jgi:hypothetical protein
MVKASRPAVKTLTLIKSRDIVVDRLLKPCEEEDHSRCTGWAVLRKEVSPIDANYFLKCTCTCHHKKEQQIKKKQNRKKQLRKKAKKKTKKKQKPRQIRKISKKSKRSRKARRR